VKPLLPVIGAAILLLILSGPPEIEAQNDDSAVPANLLESDIDSLFDEPESPPGEDPEAAPGEDPGTSGGNLLTDVVKKRGLTFGADYSFVAGYSPGYSEAPWYWREKDEAFTQIIAVDMASSLFLDIQLSPSLRVKQSFRMSFPDYDPVVKEFFCDYTLLDLAYFRIGKHTVNWGLSSNYPFTNLPARIPFNNSGGDSYAMKADVPIGIGGVQLLSLTRPGFVADQDNPNLDEAGYGLKYNLALPQADINIGSFYHKQMALRGYLSVKSTLADTVEAYSEGLVAVDQETFGDMVYAGSIGFLNDFFDGNLTVNGEYFYNGERYSSYYKTASGIVKEEITPFIYGHNIALNLKVRPGAGDLRFFAAYLFNFNEWSGQIVPGCTLSPSENMTIYLAFPMALGGSGGTYYSSNVDRNNRPFSASLIVSIKGSFRKGWYE
jgi:hypothetical protein